MARFGTIVFEGVSGQKYTFTAYSRDTSFKAPGAVYFMTKRTEVPNSGASNIKIYVGQTGDLSNRPLNHHRKSCFDRFGANCVCIYLEEDNNMRNSIEMDIMRKYDPPCNKQ
jgi:hypothetical protein